MSKKQVMNQFMKSNQNSKKVKQPINKIKKQAESLVASVYFSKSSRAHKSPSSSKPKQLIQSRVGMFSKANPLQHIKKRQQGGRGKEKNKFKSPNQKNTLNKHNPPIQIKKQNKQKQLRKIGLLKQKEGQPQNRQFNELIKLAKTMLARLKTFDVNVANECEQIVRQIQNRKGKLELSLKMLYRIFNVIDKSLQTALQINSRKKQQKEQEDQIVRQRTSQIEQFDPKLFACKILYDYDDFRQYLLEIMAKQCGKVSKTELIYRYDIHNKVNIHKYIDNKEKLLFLIQTHHDYIIAAYTQAPFQPNTIQNDKSFIASLSNGRYFRKINDKKSLIYDPIYVVFGNSDIRIKGDELFSNLGVNNSSYESKGERSHVLFGEGANNTTVIKQMEVFKVSF